MGVLRGSEGDDKVVGGEAGRVKSGGDGGRKGEKLVVAFTVDERRSNISASRVLLSTSETTVTIAMVVGNLLS